MNGLCRWWLAVSLRMETDGVTDVIPIAAHTGGSPNRPEGRDFAPVMELIGCKASTGGCPLQPKYPGLRANSNSHSHDAQSSD